MFRWHYYHTFRNEWNLKQLLEKREPHSLLVEWFLIIWILTLLGITYELGLSFFGGACFSDFLCDWVSNLLTLDTLETVSDVVLRTSWTSLVTAISCSITDWFLTLLLSVVRELLVVWEPLVPPALFGVDCQHYFKQIL